MMLRREVRRLRVLFNVAAFVCCAAAVSTWEARPGAFTVLALAAFAFLRLARCAAEEGDRLDATTEWHAADPVEFVFDPEEWQRWSESR